MIHELFKLFNWMGSEWVLGILAFLSVVVVAVALQRWMEIRSLTKQSSKFWNDVGEKWFSSQSNGQWKKQIGELRPMYKGLELDTLDVIDQAQSQGGTSLDGVVDAYLEHRRLKLEKYVSVLGTIGANAAFLGLLGTVLGVIRAFSDMSARGLSSGVEGISAGIAEALVATAVGLCVAIPAVVCFNMLNRKIGTLIRRAKNVGALVISQGK